MPVRSRWNRPLGFLLAALTAIMTIVLSGCYLVPPKLPDDLSTPPPAVPRKRTITIATAADRPPMMFKDKTSGEIVGADRELMTALAAEWKTELRVIEAPRDQLLDLVASGKVDLAMGGVLDTVEDQRKVTFVDYFKPGVRIYTTAGRLQDFGSKTSLCGRTVAVASDLDDQQVGVFSEENCAHLGRPVIRRVRANSAKSARQLLDRGRVDLVAHNAESYAYLTMTYPGQYSGVLDPLPTGRYAVAVKISDTELARAVVAGFVSLRAGDAYDDILRRWYLSYGRARPEINGVR